MNSLQIKKLIKKKQLVFSVYGLGNVGGPITATWLKTGAKIIGVDKSKNLLDSIKNGISHKQEPLVSKILCDSIKNGNLNLTSDGALASKNSNIKIVTVPVFFKKNKINFNSLISVSKDIAKGIKKNDVIIISSSLPPGTSRNIVLDTIEKSSDLKSEKDFLLIYNPERIFTGRSLQDIEQNYPAIISGINSKSLNFAKELFKIISKKGVIPISSLEAAEAEKLFEGVYRDVNIALANELADYCEKFGINYWETRKAANTQPFCNLHYPGTGVGGSCIPIYPKFIINSGKQIKKSLKLIQSSRKINDLMPIKCVKDSQNLLKKHKISLKNAQITILGLSFRGDVDDSRLSPTYDVVNTFLKNGCKITIHDPFIDQDPNLPKNVTLTSNFSQAIKDADLIFISTDHKFYSKLNKNSFSKNKKSLLIYDGRNILNKNNFKDIPVLTIGEPDKENL